MHIQLNEQFIVDEHGSKQAVVIPFANYLKIIDILRQYNEPVPPSNDISIWQTHKGNAQGVKAWLAADTDQHYPVGDPKHIDRTLQEIRDAWGDE